MQTALDVYACKLAGSGSLQQPITEFVSAGGGGSGAQQLEAFYRRLASTPEQQLPSSSGRVQLTLALPASAVSRTDINIADVSNTSVSADPAGEAAGGAPAVSYEVITTGSNSAVEVMREEWLVCNQLGGGEARAAALKAWREEKVKMVPWVGVAARLSSSRGLASPAGADVTTGLCITDAAGALVGRAFCFLPLPAVTGLPLHINGYFELSSNRRDVWHGADMAGAGRLRAQVRRGRLNLVLNLVQTCSNAFVYYHCVLQLYMYMHAIRLQ
jgi:sacsin